MDGNCRFDQRGGLMDGNHVRLDRVSESIKDIHGNRAKVIRLLEIMKDINNERLGGMAGEFGNGEDVSRAFEDLDEHFIAPHAATSPEIAERGYDMLRALMWGAFADSERANIVAYEAGQVERGKKGGEENRKSSKKRQAEKWAVEALSHAQDFVSRHKRYTQVGLARHLKRMLEDRAPSPRQIISVIVGWQKNGLIPAAQD